MEIALISRRLRRQIDRGWTIRDELAYALWQARRERRYNVKSFRRYWQRLADAEKHIATLKAENARLAGILDCVRLVDRVHAEDEYERARSGGPAPEDDTVILPGKRVGRVRVTRLPDDGAP